MKCSDRQLLEDYLDGELTDAARQKLEEHLDVCDKCRATLEEERTLAALLRGQEILKAPEGFLEEVMEDLPKLRFAGLLPDWISALGVGLLVTFFGIMVGKYASPAINNLKEKIVAFFEQIDLFSNVEEINQITQSDCGAESFDYWNCTMLGTMANGESIAKISATIA